MSDTDPVSPSTTARTAGETPAVARADARGPVTPDPGTSDPGADPAVTDPVLAARARAALGACGAPVPRGAVPVRTPVSGGVVASTDLADATAVTRAVDAAHAAFTVWRDVPAPVRGALVKRFGRLVEEHRGHLASLVQVEVGKTTSEALGEVQEVVDVCDHAVGLSRSLAGRTMPSERPGHQLVETWHPRGVVAVISAFNFPAAVWAWNTTVALVCGDTVVWKPSERTPLTSLACAGLLARAVRECGAPVDVHRLVQASAQDCGPLLDDPRVALVSATGSERMGRAVAPRVAARFGASLLELGGNNAAVVAPSADLDLTVRAVVFAAAGTAGQRCTTLRRLIVHEDVVDELLARLVRTYAGLRVGDPTRHDVLVGPLVDGDAYGCMQEALRQARADGGQVLVGGGRVGPGHGDRDDALAAPGPDAYYVRPALVRMPAQTALVRRETFAPLLHVLTYRHLDEAVALNNDVPQGLSSSIFTLDQREAGRFMSAAGSDCGIVNVNVGTSGAEVGGAFGGEKTTGGGRECGSDAWRAYMRRSTGTVNHSAQLPLAQGVSFG